MVPVGEASPATPLFPAGSGITEQLLESLPVAVYVCSTDGVIRYFNRCAAELWGRRPVVGDTEQRFWGSFKLFFADGRTIPHDQTPMAEALRSGQAQRNQEAIVERPDRSRIHVLVNIEPLFDEQGVLIGAVNAFQDITEKRAAEQTLKETEQRFSRFMQHLPGLAWIKDVEGRYVYANAAAARAFGRPLENLYGHTDQDMFPPETARQFRQNDDDAVKSVAGVQVVESLLQEDGIVHSSLVSKFPIYGPDGEVAFIGGMAIDITENQRINQELAESEQRFRVLAETIPSMIWSAAPDGTITYTSPQWLRYCNLSDEDSARHWSETVVHPDDRERCLEIWERGLRDGTPFEVEMRIRRYDGVYRWFMTRAVPVTNQLGEVTCWYGATTDVHDQVDMKKQLSEADQRKDQFLAMLAHELRNPLAPIRSGIDLLAMRVHSEREIIELMRGQMVHLVRLVDDLLDVSRIVRDRIELRRSDVEVSAIIKQSLDATRDNLESRRQELTVSFPEDRLWLNADAVRLVQVVENLLNNASKYTDVGGRIELTAERREQHVVISVQDNGVGIEPDMLSSVFDLFMQSSNSLDRSQGGLGIGLTLVKSLVELHGGSINAHSDGLGTGSRFEVTLPLAEKGNCNVEQPSLAAPLRARRILVVEDDMGSATVLSRLLSHLGSHEVGTAIDGPTAIAKVKQYKPEIILLDIVMPGMDGYEVARILREECDLSDVLLVAITGYGREEDRRKTEEAGFDMHLVKPVGIEALRELLFHPKLSET